MRPPRRAVVAGRWPAAAAVAVAVAVGVPALAARPPGAGPGTGPDTSPRTFIIRGDVEGLYPGSVVQTAVEVVNDGPQALVVTSLTATPASASPGCPGTLIAADHFEGTVEVPARSTVAVPVTWRMVAAPPDECQGATFPVTYNGSATRG